MLKYEKAVIVAASAHKGQKRKGSGEPYIIHPITVAMILQNQCCKGDIINAALLHDTVEDTELTLKYIEEVFGEKVARLVCGASEPDKSLPWKTRKEHTINYLKKAPLDERMLICADKLHNISSTIDDYHEKGEGVWSGFNAGREQQKWYYCNIVKNLLLHDDYPDEFTLLDELKEAVSSFFDISL